MYSVKTFYKYLGIVIFFEVTILRSCFAKPLKIAPPWDPKQDVEYVDVEGLSDEYPEQLPNIESIRVETDIRFRYARTKIISRIANYDQKKSHPMNFTLMIPSEAFITNLEMRVDGRIYVANITTNEDAESIYKFSEKEGRSVTAGILEQGKTANSLTLNFVIGAKKIIRFRLTYEELLVRNIDRYEYTFNLKSDQLMISVQNYRIKVTIDESQPIKVHVPPMHKEFTSVLLDRQPKINKISPTKTEVNWIWENIVDPNLFLTEIPFEDVFILQYELENEMSSGEILIRNGYFVHFFAPVGMKPLTKHVVFVLDISDSMMGEKLKLLQSAMMEILDDLKPEDFFNIIAFSTDIQLWSHYYGNKSSHLYPFPATAQYKDSAKYFIQKKLHPHGSTNIFGALEKALEVCQNVSSSKVPNEDNNFANIKRNRNPLNESLPENVESIILFLTDGEPTSGIIDHNYLLQNIRAMNTNPFVPIYTLAFGENADYQFLKELSSENGAFSRKISEASDADVQVANFYNQISMPVMSNVTFKYTSKNPRFSYQINVSNEDHLIFKGKEVIIAGQLKYDNSSENSTNLNAVIQGKSHLGQVLYTSKVNSVCVPHTGIGPCSDDQEEAEDLFISRLLAYLSIKKLVIKDLLTLPPHEYENLTFSDCEDAFGNEDQLNGFTELENFRKPCEYIHAKEKIIDAAIKYKFVTPFTSLIMRTKSIAEEENEYNGQSQSQRTWEWFLGSEIPAPRTMKISAVDANANEPEISAVFSGVPRAQALKGDDKLSNSTGSAINATTPTNATSTNSEYANEVTLNLNSSQIAANRRAEMKSALSLLKIRLMSIKNNSSSKVENTRNDHLTLSDIKWLGSSEILNIPVNEQNNTIPTYYRVLRDSEFNSTLVSSFQLCTSNSSETLVECRHLKDCVRKEFLNDFMLFKTSYVCSKVIGDERFLGSCCPLY